MTATPAQALPMIIQGGMGIGVSDWRLAGSVSRLGQLGVVSGTALDSLFVRRLQEGDVGGHLRRAMEAFPFPEVSADALKEYFLAHGRTKGTPYRLLAMWKQNVRRTRGQLAVLASFVEVHLAKEGHDGQVGINLLTKVQMPNLATLYGAMLAGVDYVLMGAGIPREIPGVLEALSDHRQASIRLEVDGPGGGAAEALTFNPGELWKRETPEPLRRPRFLPIVASNLLARMLARKANGRIDGFVVEGPTAGGHNAPPRGPLRTNEKNEPVYGERDVVDLEELAELELPFWLAGGVGSPDGLAAALESGAAGIQVGTLFADATESGIAPDLKARVLDSVQRGEADLQTDMRASPTGFPFKVVRLPTVDSALEERARICDLGYLRTAYRRGDGRIGYRCPAEPVDAWVKKGGRPEETEGRRCLCNALMADVGFAQERAAGPEPPLLTSGNDLLQLGRFLGGRTRYSAKDVVDHLLSGRGSETGSRRANPTTSTSSFPPRSSGAP